MKENHTKYSLKVPITYSSYSDIKTALYSYNGVIDQELLKKVVSFHENILNDNNYSHSFKRKVITSMIESLQNISRYGIKTNEGCPEGRFLSYYHENDLVFECCNLIHEGQFKYMSEQLKALSACPLDNLKELYLEKLNEEWYNPQSGAKLGLLYLFINSEKNISYSFQINKENNYLFTLKVSLKR